MNFIEQQSAEKIGSLALANYLYQISLEDEERRELESDYYSMSDEISISNENIHYNDYVEFAYNSPMEHRLQSHIDRRIKAIVDEQLGKFEKKSQLRMNYLINELTSIRMNLENLIKLNLDRNALVSRKSLLKRLSLKSNVYWKRYEIHSDSSETDESDFEYKSYHNSDSE